MQAKTQQAITPSSESPDTSVNFQGHPAHRAGQRGSHKPATARWGHAPCFQHSLHLIAGLVKPYTSEMAPSGAERREVKWCLPPPEAK